MEEQKLSRLIVSETNRLSFGETLSFGSRLSLGARCEFRKCGETIPVNPANVPIANYPDNQPGVNGFHTLLVRHGIIEGGQDENR